ncbi:NADPH-dependent 7-cyano-7-deazaguanine reductase QueF [Aliiglaciecola sp. CAU 1673]|uniref:NADPH-dependent 7-cyano-7-deazaguanine reductase QueF n=1 Tax=Aliiglaciecola sp. CAU 1673 TaxID=3032595 RepID=UPI0023DB38C7|nr:NADPH-dependent 7-cyano-7-deazaguanine reductase QueF [Aliiglaciecola sp. CAU 1673]MDF2179640.1 NADPH-dependent 7-cyano-7-deazaguanine reductase QueF [Aliiglaciecola sp. CAU 1673]
MTKPTSAFQLDSLTLGKTSAYPEVYAPELLQAVPRSLNRDELGIVAQQPFSGVDIWNSYELSWLNSKGKPRVALMQAILPADSPNLIESKSFKLYLNSFNQWKVENEASLTATLSKDLSACAGAPVKVRLFHLDDIDAYQVVSLKGDLLDDLDIEVSEYQLQPSCLLTLDNQVSQTYVSHLLKSNCLITNQPDWASVQIRYEGKQIEPKSLLRYLISFRQHNEFHEQCVERIFCDIMRHCAPEKLTVYARYTRRGGLDINPFRSNYERPYANGRLIRQ